MNTITFTIYNEDGNGKIELILEENNKILIRDGFGIKIVNQQKLFEAIMNLYRIEE